MRDVLSVIVGMICLAFGAAILFAIGHFVLPLLPEPFALKQDAPIFIKIFLGAIFTFAVGFLSLLFVALAGTLGKKVTDKVEEKIEKVIRTKKMEKDKQKYKGAVSRFEK